jgi:hypothetical protein
VLQRRRENLHETQIQNTRSSIFNTGRPSPKHPRRVRDLPTWCPEDVEVTIRRPVSVRLLAQTRKSWASRIEKVLTVALMVVIEPRTTL